MEITVSKEVKKFYLAFKNWAPAFGHEIQVGPYRFCAIPMLDHINISEVTSGTKVFDVWLTPDILSKTSTKEDALKFFESVGEKLLGSIIEHDNFYECVEDMKKITFGRLGKMPPIENHQIEGAD